MSQILVAQPTQLWKTTINDVATFSSPKVIDLNNDGIKDIIIGAGKENDYSSAGIFAFDGFDGHILWQLPARNQIYGSPIFQDINNDEVSDVFISGRDAQLLAINGATGQVIWEFFADSLGYSLDSNWYNFYLPTWIPDQNSDGFQDLIITNGGDATASANDSLRPAGYLMAISGLDGQILSLDTMPDGQETYHSPLVVDFFNNGQLTILFGSGGETVAGKYYSVELNDFMQNGLTNATILLSDSIKGYIAVPSLADLNDDNILDIIVPQHNSSIIALDGATKNKLWQYNNLGAECYTSPTIGQFTNDTIPDIFAIIFAGKWPFYQMSIKVLLDGATGQAIWTQGGFPYQFSSGVAVDWDNDGIDEILLARNYDDGWTTVHYKNQFEIIDFNDNTITPFDTARNGVITFSMPLLTDLNNDQSLDLIYTTNDNIAHWYTPNGFSIHRLDLDFYRNQIAWSGYLGSVNNGQYNSNSLVSTIFKNRDIDIQVYPNPTENILFFKSANDTFIKQIDLFSVSGQLVKSVKNVHQINLSDLPSGAYFYKIIANTGVMSGKVIKLK